MPKTKTNFGFMYGMLALVDTGAAAVLAAGGYWVWAGIGLIEAAILGMWFLQCLKGDDR